MLKALNEAEERNREMDRKMYDLNNSISQENETKREERLQ